MNKSNLFFNLFLSQGQLFAFFLIFPVRCQDFHILMSASTLRKPKLRHLYPLIQPWKPKNKQSLRFVISLLKWPRYMHTSADNI